MKWDSGGAEVDNGGAARKGKRREQIEKVRERKMRLSWERKERASAMWVDRFRGRIYEVIVIVDSRPADVAHAEVSK